MSVISFSFPQLNTRLWEEEKKNKKEENALGKEILHNVVPKF